MLGDFVAAANAEAALLLAGAGVDGVVVSEGGGVSVLDILTRGDLYDDDAFFFFLLVWVAAVAQQMLNLRFYHLEAAMVDKYGEGGVPTV